MDVAKFGRNSGEAYTNANVKQARGGSVEAFRRDYFNGQTALGDFKVGSVKYKQKATKRECWRQVQSFFQ